MSTTTFITVKDPKSAFDGESIDSTTELSLRHVDPGTPGWNPDLKWTPEEEAEVRRIFDCKLMPYIFFMFIFLNLDRFNISNALTNGFVKSINGTLDTINLGATLLLVGFCIFEIPSNMVIQKIGANRWLPFLMVGWGLVSTFQMFVSEPNGFLATRFLIGAFEAGWIPGVILYLSFHYKRSELATRLAIFWSCNNFSSAISGLLAYGILRMDGVSGLKGWQWLFALEGSATVLVAFASFFILPDAPHSSSLLTVRQRQIAVSRVIRDDPYKAVMAHAHVPLREVWAALSDWNVWPNLVFAFSIQFVNAGFGLYLPLIIQSFGFDALLSNLLTVPNQLVALALAVISGYLADKFKVKWKIIVAGQLSLLIGYVLNLVIPFGSSTGASYFASIVVVASFLPWHAVNAAWQAANVAPAGKRAIVFSMYIISVNISSALGVWLYRDDDRPQFRRAFSISVAIVAFAIALTVARRFQLDYLNRLREKKWATLTQDQKDQYIREDSPKLGDRGLNYRYTW